MSKITSKPAVKFNLIERAFSFVSPRWGLERLASKSAVAALQSTGYVVPGSSRRSMQGWFPTANTADEDTLSSLSDIRAGSRDLSMNNPIGIGALKRVKTNVVGGGLQLQSRPDYKFLKLTEEAADDWQRNTEREFALWAESKECDATGHENFYELQGSAIYNAAMSGELFAVLPFLKKRRSPYKLAIQLIEADLCANPQGVMNSSTLVEGIKYDEWGRELSYYFIKKMYQQYAESYTEIPAYGSNGRTNVIHLFSKERIGQRRGLPLLAPVIETVKQLGRYSEAELMSTIIASFFTVFIKNPLPVGAGLSSPFVPSNSVIPNTDGTPTYAHDQNKIELAAGAIHELGEGQDIEIADPKRPNQGFDQFFYAYLKQVGSALEIPFEQLVLHFSSSYSASRAALLEAWKFYKSRRLWLIRGFCEPIYREWMVEAITTGRIEAPGFFDDAAIEKAWLGSAWGGPGMGQIDPKKETEASVMKIENALSTHEDEYTLIHGGNNGGWDSTVERLSREKRYLKELNLTDDNSESTPQSQETPSLDDLEDER